MSWYGLYNVKDKIIRRYLVNSVRYLWIDIIKVLYNGPNQLRSPPQSPGVNAVRRKLDRRTRKNKVTNVDDLKKGLLGGWNRIVYATKKLVSKL